MSTQILSALIGVWLMFAPAVLSHSGTTLASFDRGIGPAMAAVSFVAAAQITRSVRWLNLPLAAALAIAPWFLDASTASKASSVLSAVAVLALTPWGRPDQREYGNGWTTVWRDDELPGFDAPRGEGG